MRWFSWIRPVDQIERTSHTVVWLVLGGLSLQLLFQWPLFAGIGLFLLFLRGFSRPSLAGTTFGSARWADYVDLRAAGCFLRRLGGVRLGRMLVSETVSLFALARALFYPPWRTSEALTVLETRSTGSKAKSVYLPEPGPPHLAVFAPSGGGKSTCFAIPNLLEDPSSSVVNDPKGELARLTAEHRRQKFGHDIVFIDPFGMVLPRGQADSFNPFTIYRDDSDTLMDDSRRLANALIVRSKEEKDPFFNSAAQVVIQTIIGFLISEAKPQDATMNRLRDIAANPKIMRELLDYLEKSDACDGMLRRLAGNVRWFQGQTEASIYSVANTHLEFLDSKPLADALSRTTFDPQKLVDGKMTIYLCLPVDRLKELRGLQRLVFTSLINLVFRAGESRYRRVRFYLDEAVSLGEVEALYSAMVFGRSYGLRLMFFFQSTSQVQQCFPESKAADFQATVASVFTGINDLRTATEVSQWIGQTTVESQSYQTSDNWGTSWNHGNHDSSQGGNYGGGTSTTYAQVGRALIQPEEVLQLPSSMGIALLPGVRPVLFEKTPYYRGAVAAPPSMIWRLIRSTARTCFALIGGPFVALALRAFYIGDADRAVNECEFLVKAAIRVITGE